MIFGHMTSYLLAYTLLGLVGAVVVSPDACRCLDSIKLPGFQDTFSYGSGGGDAKVPLTLTYNEGLCRGVNFHARLRIPGDNRNIGCLAGGDGGATSFRPESSSEDKIVTYRPEGNFCNIKGTELCPKGRTSSSYIELTADGCTPSGTFTGNGNAANQPKRLVNSPPFSCAADPSVSKSATLKRKLEVELGSKPVNLRCRSGYQACRTAAKRWECLQIDDLDSCGGCPGTSAAQDCTEIPAISAVQCVNGKCQVYKCMRGFKLVDNACVIDPSGSSRSSTRSRRRGERSYHGDKRVASIGGRL